MSQIINMVGLAINACGAALLIVFSSPGFMVGKDGEVPIIPYTHPPPDQLAFYKRKYKTDTRDSSWV